MHHATVGANRFVYFFDRFRFDCILIDEDHVCDVLGSFELARGAVMNGHPVADLALIQSNSQAVDGTCIVIDDRQLRERRLRCKSFQKV